MPELQEAAQSKFRGNTSTFFGLRTFIDAIHEAFTNDGYDYFRSAMVNATVDRIAKIRSDPEGYKRMWEAIETIPLFAAEVLRAQA